MLIFKNSFFIQIRSLLTYLSLCARDLNFVLIYSEGSHQWPDFYPVIKKLLAKKIKVVFFTSSIDDVSLNIKHKNFISLYIGKYLFRDWLFLNIKNKIIITSLPDIGNSRLKISRYATHYIYIQHSLVSIHSCYKKNAFKNYDVICASTKYQRYEILEIIEKEKLKNKKVIIDNYNKFLFYNKDNFFKKKSDCSTFLIAPSWNINFSKHQILLKMLIKILLEKNKSVIFRPHTETIKRNQNFINYLNSHYKNNIKFTLDLNYSVLESIAKSDVLISDYSGIVFDFILFKNKKVLFLDVTKKINNQDYYDYKKEGIEFQVRKNCKLINVENLNNFNFNNVDNVNFNTSQIYLRSNLSRYIMDYLNNS